MSGKKKLIWGGLLCILAITGFGATTKIGQIILVRLLTTESVLRDFEPPAKTNWHPSGVRRTAENTSINARQASFAMAFHTDMHGSDEIGTVVAPMFELDWIAEPTMFVAEGPLFDSQGNIYFCPVFPPENVIMISLDAKTGKRRWVLKGKGNTPGAGAGAPIILKDPDTGEEILYLGTYDRVVAMKTDGTIIYDVPTGLPEIEMSMLSGSYHSFGMNYQVKNDAIMAVMGDGYVYAFDRKSGRPLLKEPYMLPGAKTPVNNINIPKSVTVKASKDLASMYGANMMGKDHDPIASVMHIVSGELQKVTNFFSIDKNSGRIWITASLPDEEDGKKDGWSDYGALYGLDMVKDGDFYKLDIKIVFKVDGGTSSTPALSADGKRAYVADAFDTVYAVDTVTGEEVWSVNVGSKVAGSIVVSTDNGEIYANTRTEIIKIIEKGNTAKVVWKAKMDMFIPGLFQSNFKVLGAEIAANGIVFTGAVGVAKEKQKFPFKIGVGVLDRETGKLIYFAEGGEDSVSSTSVGPDGSIYIGNSPLRRILARVAYGKDLSPNAPTGGISRFKPVRYDLLIRDALWAASRRLENAGTIIEQNKMAAEQDVYQVGLLVSQARSAAQNALTEGTVSPEEWQQLKGLIAVVEDKQEISMTFLEKAAKAMAKAVDLLEKK